MPGLFGVVRDPSSGIGAEQGFEAVRAAMARGGRLLVEARVDDRRNWALGRVHLGTLQPEAQLAEASQVRVLFHGDLHNHNELNASLERSGAASGSTAAATVRALYQRQGSEAAQHLKGQFVAAILDEDRHELLLVSDRFGSYPLYWFTTGDAIVFASELRAALRAHPRPALDPVAVADFLKFGFPLGDKTLAAGVTMLPSGSVLKYRWRDHAVTIEPYSSIAEVFQSSATNRTEFLARLEETFAGAMARTTTGSHRYGISLSGGLDTRVILSALDRMGCTVSSFTLGGRGCADEVIAEELSRMARTRHRFVALDDQYLDDLLPTVQRMVTLTDGMYLSHGFTEMLALRGFEESDASVLLRGHCGELAKASTAWPLHTDARIFGMTSTEEFVPYMLNRLTHVSRGNAASEVLSDRWIEALQGGSAAQSLSDSLAGVTLSPPDLCSYLYLKEYHRRVTVPSLEIFRSAIDVRLPLADEEFVAAVLLAPATWRDDTSIHKALVRATNPAYLRVRNPNTGTAAGAGPLREAVFDKVNSVLRRLNVHGYRHYHSFDGWMRRAFLKLVDDVLLDPQTLGRGVFRESAVAARVSQAHQGVKDHDDLLQALVIVELWQRDYT